MSNAFDPSGKVRIKFLEERLADATQELARLRREGFPPAESDDNVAQYISDFVSDLNQAEAAHAEVMHALQRVRGEEREACAKLADPVNPEIAAAIRARSSDDEG